MNEAANLNAKYALMSLSKGSLPDIVVELPNSNYFSLTKTIFPLMHRLDGVCNSLLKFFHNFGNSIHSIFIMPNIITPQCKFLPNYDSIRSS